MASPATYNLPLAQFRPYQEESVQWAASAKNNTVLIGEMPTGSGKSVVAMAQSVTAQGQVVVLTKSKNLQQQYATIFNDCAVLFGRNNYDCLHSESTIGETVADCRFRDNASSECNVYDECLYRVARSQAMLSERVALNYAYYLVAGSKWHPTYLVLDEAHILSDIVLNWTGITITKRDLDFWGLPSVPEISTNGMAGLFKHNDPIGDALAWLEDASAVLRVHEANLNRSRGNSDAVLKRRRSLQSVTQRFANTFEALSNNPGPHWYIKAGQDATWLGAGLLCKPLTARYDAPRFFFDGQHKTLAMSATIGNPVAFAKELGITNYDMRVVPNQWPPKTRQIEILDCPSMGKQSAERDPGVYEKQAQVIAKKIKELPSTWAGLLLVTRKTEATLLADRLRKLGLAERIFVMPGADGTYVPTQQQVSALNAQLAKKPNTICISFSLWEGYDGTNINFVIICKIPYPYQDSYERARMAFDGTFYLQRTAYTLEQGCGRCRRGERSDYNVAGEFNTYVGIADASWKRIRNYLSASMRESIVCADKSELCD